MTTTHPGSTAATVWPGTPATRVARVAVGLSLLAGAIHLAVTPEHAREWWLSGGFFAVVTAAQLGLAWLLVVGAGTRTLLAGIWGNLAVVGVYLTSRTVGLPLEPPHTDHGPGLEHQPVAGGIGTGMPVMPGTDPAVGRHLETVGSLDLLALGAELGLVAALLTMLPLRHRRSTLDALLAIGVLVWGLRIAGLLGP